MTVSFLLASFCINFGNTNELYRVSELAVVRDVLKKYIDPEQAGAVYKHRYSGHQCCTAVISGNQVPTLLITISQLSSKHRFSVNCSFFG